MIKRIGCFAAFAGALLALQAQAQTYPSRSIRLVNPYVAGSPVDVMGRVLFNEVSARLGQTVIIENRPGAGTTIGTRVVAAAAPDGYTLLLAGQALAYMNYFYPKLKLDPAKDFTSIGTLSGWSHVMIVRPGLPVKTLQEFVAYAKENPGKIRFGFGLGTGPQILGEYFKVIAGIDMLSVPYRGGENARQDLLAGQIDMNFVPISNVLALMQSNSVRVIALTHHHRTDLLPGYPTFEESGYAQLGFDPDSWTALSGPAGLSREIVDKLNKVVNDSLKAKAVLDTFRKLAIEPMPGTPEQMDKFLASHIEKWPRILKAAKINPP